MKVAHVISAPAAGGAEVYVKDLVKYLSSYDCEAHVIFLSAASDIGRSQEFEKTFLEELRGYGIPVFFLGHKCRKNVLLGALKVRQYCLENSIDVYHSHLLYGLAFGVFLNNISRVYTHHSVKPRLNKAAYRLLNFFVEYYVGISQICTHALASQTNRAVSLILNGVDERKLIQRRRARLTDNKIKAVSIGRVTEQKDYYFLVESVKLLPKTIRDKLCVLIAGEGEKFYTDNLKGYIARQGLKNNFKFLGNRSDIPKILDNADLFLMSSAWEGLPIALIEATASCLPCVVTDVGGCREVIDLCGNGLVVPYGKPELYASALLEVICQPDSYYRFASNAFDNRGVLSISNSAKSHFDLYSQAIKQRS